MSAPLTPIGPAPVSHLESYVASRQRPRSRTIRTLTRCIGSAAGPALGQIVSYPRYVTVANLPVTRSLSQRPTVIASVQGWKYLLPPTSAIADSVWFTRLSSHSLAT